jgi:hypothetical protein
MMDLRVGDVVLIDVPFHQAHAPSAAEFDLMLKDWRSAGLNVASTVRIHKIAVLSKASIRRTIGGLAAADLASVQTTLCRAFCAHRVEPGYVDVPPSGKPD